MRRPADPLITAASVGAVIVGIAAAAVSSVDLYALAQDAALDGPLPAALPIALDAGALVGTLVWLRGGEHSRRTGRGLALGCLALSIAGNIAHRLIQLRVIDIADGVTRFVLGVSIGAVFPVVLAWMVHTRIALNSDRRARPTRAPRADRPTPPREPRPEPAPAVEAITAPTPAPSPTPADIPAGPPTLHAVDSDWRVAAARYARAEIDAGRKVTGDSIATRFNKSSAAGRRVLATLRDNDSDAVPAPTARRNP